MADVTKNLRDATMKIEDGAGTPNSITLALEEGDLSYAIKQNVINVLDRGSLSHQREGDEEPVTGSFTVKYVELIKQTASSNPTPYEALTQTGAAASWTSTNTDGGGVYNTSIILEINDPDATNQDERTTLSKVRATSIDFSEGDEYNTLAFEFQAFVTKPTVAKF